MLFREVTLAYSANDLKLTHTSENLGSCGVEYEDDCIQECNAVKFGKYVQLFWRNLLQQFHNIKSKTTVLFNFLMADLVVQIQCKGYVEKQS